MRFFANYLFFSVLLSNEQVQGQAASQLCQRQGTGFFTALKRGESWALIMRDSWGLRPSGISYGNRVNFGNFDQCYTYKHAHSSLGAINGQYCLVTVKELNETIVNVPQYRISVCVPASCDPTELGNLIDEYLSENGFRIVDPFIACEKFIQPEWTPLQWFSLGFFVVSILLIGISTTLDVVQKHRLKNNQHQSPIDNEELNKPMKYNNIISMFSLNKNLSDTLNCGGVASVSSAQKLDCLHGVRGISVLWIIYQHTYFLQMSLPLINDNYKYQWSEHLFGMTYKSGRVIVDNFLFMSGLLVTWNFLHDRQKGKPLNLMKMYANRYIRITTALAPIILFIVTFLRYSGSGPEWSLRTNQMIEFCDKHWWSALLHIQNYANPTEPCVFHAWYLSVDMQLFILSPLILIPIWKWGARVLWLVVVLIGLILIYIFVIVIYKDVHISIFLNQTSDHTIYIYMPTHARAIPWLIGILAGFYLFHSKGKAMIINKVAYITLWLISIILLIAVIFAPYEANKPNVEVGRIVTAIYYTFSNFSWVLGITWIVIACCKHPNNIINKFLSHRLWLPLSRLSFTVYLVHFQLQYMIVSSTKSPIHFSDIEMLYSYCGDVGFALIIGLGWYLVYELPFSHLARHYLGSGRTQTHVKGNTGSEPSKTTENNV